MHLFHAVAGPLTLEIVALHCPRETAALRHASDVDGLHAFEHIDRDLPANFRFTGRTTQLANEPLGFAAGLIGRLHAGGGELLRAFAFELGNMATFTAAGEAPRLVEKAELHCVVAVVLPGANLEHMTRARLHDRDGDAGPRFVINLRHPDLAAEYSLGHRKIPSGQFAPQDRESVSRVTRDASSRYKTPWGSGAVLPRRGLDFDINARGQA